MVIRDEGGPERIRPEGGSEGARAIRVFIVEDHLLVRDAIAAVLRNDGGFEVIGDAGTADEALPLVIAGQPDVVVQDISLAGDMDGIALCREIRSRSPETQVMILTGLPDESLVMEAVLAGAAGYITKGIGLNDLPDIIRRIGLGESMLESRATEALLDSIKHGGSSGSRNELTTQEARILELIAKGLTNRQIAQELNLAEQTVKNYVSNVLSKLGVERRTQAAVYATRRHHN